MTFAVDWAIAIKHYQSRNQSVVQTVVAGTGQPQSREMGGGRTYAVTTVCHLVSLFHELCRGQDKVNKYTVSVNSVARTIVIS